MMNKWKQLLIVLGVCMAVCSHADTSRLARGRMALEDGFHSQAISIFQRILQDTGTSDIIRAEAADFLLRTYAAQNDYDQVRAFLEDPVHGVLLDTLSRSYWSAMLLDRRGDWQGVLDRLDALPDEVAASSARVLQLRASAYLQLDAFDAASELFAHLARTLADKRQAGQNRLDWGRTLHSAGRYDEAISVWKPLLELGDYDPTLAARARYLIGEIFIEKGRHEDAEEVLAQLAEEVGQGDVLAVSALIMKAQSRQSRGDLDGAIDLYRDGIESLGTHSLRRRLKIELGRTLLDGGALEQGKQEILSYVQAYTDSPEAPGLLLELGRRMLRAERYAEALVVYQRYLEAFGDRNGVASHGRGLALRGVGRHGEAAVAFAQSHAQAPEGSRKEETLFLGAQSRYKNGQFRLAAEQMGLYANRYQDGQFYFEAHYYRGNAFAALGQLEEAVAVFEDLAEAVRDTAIAEKALLRIGELYLEREEWASAEYAFERVLNTFPEGRLFMQAMHGRGLARHHQWNAEAHADFVRVAEEANDAALREHALFLLAVRHFHLGQDDEAIAICHQLLEEAPDSIWASEVRFRLAQFAFNAGRYESAEAAFLAFVEKHPDHSYVPQSLFRAGLAAIRRQQFVTGNEILGRMAQQFPQHPLLPYARFHQAEALVQLGRHSTAILTFQEVIRLAPNTEIAYMAWGREGDSHYVLAANDPTRLEAAARAYQVVLQGGRVRLHDRLQAAYKLGLTYEKMGRTAAALEQYYDGVIVPFHLALSEDNGELGSEAKTWYSRAVRNATAILDRQQEWRSMVSILDRAAATEADIADEAKRRAGAVRSEYWWLFY